MKFLHLHPVIVIGGVVFGAILLFTLIAYWILN